MTEAPYGAWRSPIAARDVARSGVRLSRVDFGDDGGIWWSEGRPEEGGRNVVVRRGLDGETVDVLPDGWNARTRVHEYGGRGWIPIGADGLVFANWDDQRLYLIPPGMAPQSAGAMSPIPLTPEPAQRQGERYADLVVAPGGLEVVCVRERAVGDGPAVSRDLVAVALDGSLAVRTVLTDRHFLSNPRFSPDGRFLSWLTWDHPRMPWDGTELRVAELDSHRRAGSPRTLMGGEEESVFQPEWAGPGHLYAVSDRTGWWNLYTVDLAGASEPICPREEEFGNPQWIFGMATYGALGDGRLVVLHGQGTRSMSLLDPTTGSLRPALSDEHRSVLGVTDFEAALSVHGERVVTLGGGATVPMSVLSYDAKSGAAEVIRRSIQEVPDSRYLPAARTEVFFGSQGRDVHAYVYDPRNPDFEAPPSELPPFVAIVHGGPTGQTNAVLDLGVAYFTSRGIGVVDIDYGGSTGYGREYRNRLRGEWGVVDVEDVVAVVEGLAEREEADGSRLLIRGGSAGGWTVLAALTRTNVFAGGASYYGVADLMGLVEDTHDFESRYIDGLVGPLPESRNLYDERSPLSHVDELECPILLLQGSEDKIVTPRQAEMFRDAMKRKGIPHAYICFEGEQHGFRRAENIERALESELSFYGQVLGFDPPDVPSLALSRASE